MKTKLKIDQAKILKKCSREIAFERYGGGQFVCMNRPHKNKKKYDRKQNKREMSSLDISLYCLHHIILFFKII